MKQLRLNTLENSRKTLAGIIRSYHRGDLEAPVYRNLIYGMSHFLNYWKEEKNQELEQRFDELDQRLTEAGL